MKRYQLSDRYERYRTTSDVIVHQRLVPVKKLGRSSKMSENTYRLIEKILIKASMERGRIHWGKIFDHSQEYLEKKKKLEVTKLAERWGVIIIGK